MHTSNPEDEMASTECARIRVVSADYYIKETVLHRVPKLKF